MSIHVECDDYDKFFGVTYEEVKKLVGKVFMSEDGATLVKVLGVRDDTDNEYWKFLFHD